jgi:CRP-like cAMP-binding protein
MAFKFFGGSAASEVASTSAPDVPLSRDIRNLLEKIDFFAGLDEKILKQGSQAVISRQYDANETIVKQGEMGLGLYIIIRGRVKVEKEMMEMRIQVAELGAEQFFAEMSIVDNKPRSATVTTVEQTECLLLTRDSFVNLMQRYPELPIRVARLLAERLRLMDERLASGPQLVPPALTTAAPPGNGKATAHMSANTGTKEKLQEKVLEIFKSLYSLKAFTPFSVAVLGCSVEGYSRQLIEQIRIGDVKAPILPADQSFEVDILADQPGSFTLTVLTPGGERPVQFGPLAVNRESRFQLNVPRLA